MFCVDLMDFMNLMDLLLFLNRSASCTHGLSGISASSSGIGLGSLSARRQTSHVSNTAISLDILQALDVAGNLSLEIALDFEGFNNFSDGVFVVDGEFFGALAQINLGFGQNLLGARVSDTIKAGKSYLKPFVFRNCNT